MYNIIIRFFVTALSLLSSWFDNRTVKCTLEIKTYSIESFQTKQIHKSYPSLRQRNKLWSLSFNAKLEQIRSRCMYEKLDSNIPWSIRFQLVGLHYWDAKERIPLCAPGPKADCAWDTAPDLNLNFIMATTDLSNFKFTTCTSADQPPAGRPFRFLPLEITMARNNPFYIYLVAYFRCPKQA